VTARAEDTFRASAIGAGLAKSEVAIGGAVAVSNESNHAYASIDSTLGVNASGRTDVHPDAELPNPATTPGGLLGQIKKVKEFLETQINSASPLFTAPDFLNVLPLAQQLVAHTDPLSLYLWDQLPGQDQELLKLALVQVPHLTVVETPDRTTFS